MNFKEVACQKVDVSSQRFLKGVDIWIRNPHVENRRILAANEILTIESRLDILEIYQRINALDLTTIETADDSTLNSKVFLNALRITDCNSLSSSSLLNIQWNGIYLRVAKLLPRNGQIFSAGVEFTIVDNTSHSVIILHKRIFKDKRFLSPDRPYLINYDDDNDLVRISVDGSTDSPCIEWLVQKLFPRLLKWMQSDLDRDSTAPTSLSLVSSEKYALLYESLKNKYGTEMVRMWPENTDPKKFVYEDVAIATYLIILWERERQEKGIDKKQSFVDLGCGNGLLVHILTSEGYSGTGIDLRKRKIWDLYPCRENLKVSTIVPLSMTLNPEIDWLIGNHSDELTPWIPVIAARTAPSCRFFLLPCCAYEFDGSKYRRYSATRSQYSEYIDYVRDVSEKCGFKTDVDRLRIPSTKRICLIGWDRANKEEDICERDARLQEVITARCTSREAENNAAVHDEASMESGWSCNFRSRDPVEKVRNCTRIDNTVIAEIVNIVADQLLRDGRTIDLEEIPGKTWNAGREVVLSDIAESIPRETLIRLRNECGGLQTLLKNHGHIFMVSQGKVSFRIPGVEFHKRRKVRVHLVPRQTKVKPCWFQEHHPDGCPRRDENCNFKH